MCRTGAGRTCPPSPTPCCSGCQGNPAAPVSVVTWPSPRPMGSELPTASAPSMAVCVSAQVTNTHTHTHTCLHTHTHTHIYTLTHAYTRIHTHTHTHTPAGLCIGY